MISGVPLFHHKFRNMEFEQNFADLEFDVKAFKAEL